MPSKNVFRANQQARSNPEAAYSLDKDLYSRMITDAYDNALKDIGEFKGTVLSIESALLVAEDAGTYGAERKSIGERANFYKVKIRPEWLEHIPAPWVLSDFRFYGQKTGIQGSDSKAAVAAHPTAKSKAPDDYGTQGYSLKIGDIVMCTFGDGPDNKGRYDDIRFDLNSVGRNTDFIDRAPALTKRTFTRNIAKLGKGLKKVKDAVKNFFSDRKCKEYTEADDNKAATVTIRGNTCQPETLEWTGYVKDGDGLKEVDGKKYGKVKVDGPVKCQVKTYIGSAVDGASGNKVYNGLLGKDFYETVTLQYGTYKKIKTAEELTKLQQTDPNSKFYQTRGKNVYKLVLSKKKYKHKILKDCAGDFKSMTAAYKKEYGCDLPITQIDRTYERMVELKSNVKSTSTKINHLNEKVEVSGYKAARPGTSKHGWGLAIDFITGTERYQANGKVKFESTVHLWLKENGWKFGWINPEWAQQYQKDREGNFIYYPKGHKKAGQKKPRGWAEPWHFEWRWRTTVFKPESDAVSWYEANIPADFKSKR